MANPGVNGSHERFDHETTAVDFDSRPTLLFLGRRRIGQGSAAVLGPPDFGSPGHDLLVPLADAFTAAGHHLDGHPGVIVVAHPGRGAQSGWRNHRPLRGAQSTCPPLRDPARHR